MTISCPPATFHPAPLLRPRHRGLDKAKLASIALTIAFHVAMLAELLTAVHVARPRATQELTVSIGLDKPSPSKGLAPPLRLVAPSPLIVQPPEVRVAAPAPPVAAAPPAAPPMAGPGEGRDSFLGLLLAQLDRFKRYPRAARQARIEGVVMLHFVMDASGKVLSAEIARSSGRPVLDDEALALIQRAQPLPALPADYPTRSLDAVVSIEFHLDR
jgi:protein TonB